MMAIVVVDAVGVAGAVFFIVTLLVFGGGIFCTSSIGSVIRFKRSEIGGYCCTVDEVDGCGCTSFDVGMYVEKRRLGCCLRLAGRGRTSSSTLVEVGIDASFGGRITKRSLG